MTRSRIRSTRRSLASRCSGVRQRLASTSGVRSAEGCTSFCSKNWASTSAAHHNWPPSQGGLVIAAGQFHTHAQQDRASQNNNETEYLITQFANLFH